MMEVNDRVALVLGRAMIRVEELSEQLARVNAQLEQSSSVVLELSKRLQESPEPAEPVPARPRARARKASEK